jgi:hypothetical protein
MHKFDPVLWEEMDKKMGFVTWFGSILRALGIPLYRCPWWWMTYQRVHRRDCQWLGPDWNSVKFHWMTIASRIYARLTRS